MRCRANAVGVDLELAVGNDVEAVAGVAGTDDELAGGHRYLDEAGCDALFAGKRERREHRHVVDELELRRRCDRPVDVDQPSVRQERQQRQE